MLYKSVGLTPPAEEEHLKIDTGNDLYYKLRACDDMRAAQAGTVGNSDFTLLLEECSMALGYIQGVFDIAGGLNQIDAPKKSIHGQVFDIVMNDLRDHPERRADPAAYIILFALQQVWPPKKQ